MRPAPFLRRFLLPVLPAAAILLILAACSGSPPRIQGSDWMPVYTRDLARGGVYEELDFFLRLEDEDGVEDISEIGIYRDDRGWAWKLSEENWISWTEDGEQWIGANGLTRSGGIPAGEFRVGVRDRSGQNSETLFEYDPPGLDPESIRFPHAELSGNSLTLDGAGREPLLLWFYNAAGELIYEQYSSPGLYPLEDLLGEDERQAAHWLMIYFRDEEGGYGLKSGPFMLNKAE